jgi:outer membrane protein OmpA-like peptidoglycan-associated protein
LIVICAVTAVALVGGLAVYFGAAPKLPHRHVVWIGEKTTRAAGTIPGELRNRVRELSATGAGTVTAYAVGGQARLVDSIDLEVLHDGEREADPVRRNSVLEGRLRDLASRFEHMAVGSDGYSLYAALRVAADESRGADSPVEVWFSTTLLTGSFPPLEFTRLLSADPQPAAQQVLKGAVGQLDLSGVELHPIMLTPIGAGQRALTPATELWRARFITDLATGLNATVQPPVHDNSVEAAWSGSADVPAVVSLPDPTRTGPARSVDPPPVRTVRIDNVSFVPDSAALVNPAAAVGTVRGVVKAYRATGRGKAVLAITGYCAAIGPAEGARQLSRQRAETLARVLISAGVDPADITTRGLGFDQRAQPNAGPADAGQRVVVIQLTPRH